MERSLQAGLFVEFTCRCVFACFTEFNCPFRQSEAPIAVPDYIAVPLLEAATLVEDEDLRERWWASLLANAANPESNPKVESAFITILSSLSPRQAQFLDILVDAATAAHFVKIRP